LHFGASTREAAVALDAQAVIRHLSVEIGGRFGGSPGDEQTAEYLTAIFADLGCDVRRQEFSFIGWRPGDPPHLRIDAATIDCAPLLYSAATGTDGVQGRLVRHGTTYLIPGVYELPSYAIVGANGQDLARIICEANGPPISLINPRQIFQLPQVVVGSDDGPAFDKLLADGGAEVSLVVNAAIVPDARTRNVVASYRGTDRPDRVVVCAHADTSLNTPGAYDNASGIGGLYELASRVVEARLEINVDFVAFACEEQGFYGASYYVNDLKERGELSQIRYVVNLDQISGGDYLWVWVGPKGFERTVRQAIDAVSLLRQYEMRFAEPMPGADDWIFAVEGVPTVSLIFWRLDVYHKPTDTFERVDIQKVKSAVEAAYSVLERAKHEPLTAAPAVV
jgi:aminopeptidase YwaD